MVKGRIKYKGKESRSLEYVSYKKLLQTKQLLSPLDHHSGVDDAFGSLCHNI